MDYIDKRVPINSFEITFSDLDFFVFPFPDNDIFAVHLLPPTTNDQFWFKSRYYLRGSFITYLFCAPIFIVKDNAVTLRHLYPPHIRQVQGVAGRKINGNSKYSNGNNGNERCQSKINGNGKYRDNSNERCQSKINGINGNDDNTLLWLVRYQYRKQCQSTRIQNSVLVRYQYRKRCQRTRIQNSVLLCLHENFYNHSPPSTSTFTVVFASEFLHQHYRVQQLLVAYESELELLSTPDKDNHGERTVPSKLRTTNGFSNDIVNTNIFIVCATTGMKHIKAPKDKEEESVYYMQWTLCKYNVFLQYGDNDRSGDEYSYSTESNISLAHSNVIDAMPILQSKHNVGSIRDGDVSVDRLDDDDFNSNRESQQTLSLHMDKFIFNNFENIDNRVPDELTGLQGFEAHLEIIDSNNEYLSPSPPPPQAPDSDCMYFDCASSVDPSSVLTSSQSVDPSPDPPINPSGDPSSSPSTSPNPSYVPNLDPSGEPSSCPSPSHESRPNLIHKNINGTFLPPFVVADHDGYLDTFPMFEEIDKYHQRQLPMFPVNHILLANSTPLSIVKNILLENYLPHDTLPTIGLCGVFITGLDIGMFCFMVLYSIIELYLFSIADVGTILFWTFTPFEYNGTVTGYDHTSILFHILYDEGVMEVFIVSVLFVPVDLPDSTIFFQIHCQYSVQLSGV